MRALAVALAAAAVAGHAEPHPLSRFVVARARVQLEAGSSVAAVPSQVQNDGDWVQVSIRSASPQASDVLAVYSPSDVTISLTAPVEWFQLSASCPSYVSTGSCQLSAQLINMRADYGFVLVHNISAPVAVAKSNAVAFRNPNQPRAPRLALTTDPTEMRLTWSSAVATGNPRVTFARWPTEKLPLPTVTREEQARIGRQLLAAGNVTIPAATSTYTAADMCGAPATAEGYRDIGIINTAVLTGLTPGDSYVYTFGDDSETHAPVTFKLPGPSFPIGIAAFGDMGRNSEDGSQPGSRDSFPASLNTSSLIAADIDTDLVHAVLHDGDLSYARGYASAWDVFFHVQAEPVMARVPYSVDLGNHEADFPNAPTYLKGTDSGGECGIPAMRLFPQPQPSANEPWYSIRMGPVAVVQMSTEWDFTAGSAQWTFLKAALGAIDRTVTPWVIFNGHRPMYIDSTNFDQPAGDQPVAELLRQHVEPLLMNAGDAPVDLGLWGHHHSYQRHCAVFNTTCTQNSVNGVFKSPTAPVQMVIGTAGAGYSTNIMTPAPPYTEYVSFTHGYARITFHNATAMEWQFVNDADGSILDTFWILK